MKYQRKQQEIICNNCQKSFLKDVSEIKRNLIKGMNNYCSKKCSSSTPQKLAQLEKYRNKDMSLLNPGNRKDQYSIFREHLRRAKRRQKDCDLTLYQMKEVWDRQQGICVYSKVKLIPWRSSKKADFLYTMSLDRINSSLGYTKDNIQFISICMNHLKNKMSHEQMLEVLQIIKKDKVF